jgi:hypothetical protein
MTDSEHLALLAQAVETARLAHQHVDDLVVQAIDLGGASWRDVGAVLGMSHQAAWEKYRALCD